MEELALFYTELEFSTTELELFVRGLLQILLLMSSAVFSGSETALFSLSRIDMQRLRQTRHPQSENIHAMLDEPRRLIISILCGNELVNIASAVNMTAMLLLLFNEQDVGWINVVVMVPMLLLVGEVTPKTIAVSFPVKFSTSVTARILPRWIVLITPLREAVRLIADRVTTWVVGDEVDRVNILQRDEFRTLLEEGVETGVIDATERVLIDNVLEAAETDISRIMTPGPRIRFLDADQPVAQLIEEFRSFRHPRIPVYRGHWDNVIGFLHSEDILKMVRGGGDLAKVKLEMLLKPAHFVPPTKKVDEMFQYFQNHRTRAAIILGEYGEVLGIVTMKDVLTFIFGEISGSIEGQQYRQQESDKVYRVPGDMRLADFYNLTNFDIEDPVMSTIGGVAFRLFDRLPLVGDRITHDGYEFIVIGRQGLRISELEVRLLGDKEREAGADAGAPDESMLTDEQEPEQPRAVEEDALPAAESAPAESPAEPSASVESKRTNDREEA